MKFIGSIRGGRSRGVDSYFGRDSHRCPGMWTITYVVRNDLSPQVLAPLAIAVRRKKSSCSCTRFHCCRIYARRLRLFAQHQTRLGLSPAKGVVLHPSTHTCHHQLTTRAHILSRTTHTFLSLADTPYNIAATPNSFTWTTHHLTILPRHWPYINIDIRLYPLSFV